ncbi:hypothetical protein BH09VER1_BH09VER1_00110 [soil metagenome]
MNFTDFGFWPRLIFLLLIAVSARTLASQLKRPFPPVYDKIALATISLYLLASVDTLTFSIFLLLASLSYAGILAVSNIPPEKRRLFLAFYIPLLLCPLIYYKYRSFLAEEVFGWEKQTFHAIAIPAGISFYTFQKIAILVDVSRLRAYRPKILDFLNFAAFFPQVVAGPIERKEELMPQMENFRLRIRWANLNMAAPWLALGFFYKLCLADNLSPFIDREAMASAWPILWNTFLFGLKIYFDFCGYSLIALGIARCLGVTLTLNFRSPYASTTIRDFWRRWHVSLSYWFRDYVYIPLGGSRTRFWALSLILVFLLSGVWHGAGWCFFLWGALHGFYCVVGHTLKDRVTLPAPIGWGATMLLVFVAWLPFYETRWPVLFQKLTLLATPAAYSLQGLTAYVHSFDPSRFTTMAAATALCLLALAMELVSIRKGTYYSYATNPIVTAILVAATVWLGSSKGNAFVYFSF